LQRSRHVDWLETDVALHAAGKLIEADRAPLRLAVVPET